MSQPKGPQKTVALDVNGNPIPQQQPAAAAPSPSGNAANRPEPSTVMMEAPAAAALAAAHKANAERAQRNVPQSGGGGGGAGKWIAGFFLMIFSAAGTAAGAHFALPYGGKGGKVTAPAAAKQSGKVKLVTDPDGASISVDGKNVPRFTPTTVEGEVGATLKVQLKLDGFKTKDVDVVVASAEEKTFTTKLEKEEAKVAANDTKPAADTKVAANDPKPAGGDKGAKEASTKETKGTKETAVAKVEKKEPSSSSSSSKHAEKTATPAPGGTQGSVSIFVRPWAIVFLDGRRVRQTPIQSLGVPAGKHTIELQNDTKGKREKLVITIEAGGTQEIRRDWDN